MTAGRRTEISAQHPGASSYGISFSSREEHDRRREAAKFYDLQDFDEDVPFYRALITSPDTSLLELGCGTGRVLLELAEACTSAFGLELSRAMLDIAREKAGRLRQELQQRITLQQGGITDFDLDRRFDLIIAPFRVFQALETDAQVDGLFRCVRRHLKPRGSCVLTMFRPIYDPETMRRKWVQKGETIEWERQVGDERIVASDRRPRLDPENLVLHPELVYRRYHGHELLEEVVMPIVMRCWYPEQIEQLVRKCGFTILNKWGGYRGEAFGEGSELVVQFEL